MLDDYYYYYYYYYYYHHHHSSYYYYPTLRRFDSDSPAILDMISGPLMRKKKAPVSLATARAISVLPVNTTIGIRWVDGVSE